VSVPQTDAPADEAAIREVFGNNFVDWILATDGQPTRTRQQRQVAALVRQESKRGVPDGAGLPAFLRLAHLAGINPESGRTFLTDLRRLAGGTDPELPEPPSDEVLGAMQEWAAENFGGLLLGEGGFSLGWGGPARERMTRAIAADPSLPFTVEDQPTDAVIHVTTIGTAGGLQLVMFGPAVVAAAYRVIAARSGSPQLADLLEELPTALKTARSVYEGKTVQTLAMAGLAGVLLPEEKPELTTPWGRVRVAYDSDNAMLDKTQGLSAMTMPDGSQLISRGTGDLTVETIVPWSAQFTPSSAGDEVPHPGPVTSYVPLQRRLHDVRVAFALAMNDAQVPALLPIWEKVENPVADTGGFSFTEIARLRNRTPTRLTVQQAEEWEQWITALDGLALENLGHAPQRLLRAITERQDPVDALVDAVIVWEAIFGTHNEITFRVCGSLARLLYSTLEERLAFVKRAKSVYTMRSKIVHGASDIKPEKISESRDQAVHVAIQALRTLVEERPDLLALADSSKRSDHIMLE
jgi:hypothetical protein